jgi:hypothetical protein
VPLQHSDVQTLRQIDGFVQSLGAMPAAMRGTDGARSDTPGARSALDLIEEHLTTPPSHCLEYTPATRGLPEGQDFQNWERPDVQGWQPSDEGNMVASIRSFASGGYELSCRRIDLPGLSRMLDARRKTGPREKPDEQDPEIVKKSARRAKRKVRHLCKSMGVDRLLTLTRREGDNNRSDWWNRQGWLDAWERFQRLCKRAGLDLCCVAVLEDHKKGNHHLHIALTGWLPVHLIRKLWALCTGATGGNVDIKKRRGNQTRLERTARIASYISKYIGKQFESSEFNKKRYFATRHTMPEVRRIILNASTTGEAFTEVCAYLGLDVLKLTFSKYGCFTFPDGGGFWLNYAEEFAIPPPF